MNAQVCAELNLYLSLTYDMYRNKNKLLKKLS